MKLADIIIPHHNRHDHLKNLLDILDNTKFNIIVVSGGSFGHNCNKGAKIAETDNLFFINDDILPKEQDFLMMLKQLRRYDIVSSTQQVIHDTCKKYYGIGLIENCGKVIPDIMKTEKGVFMVSGFCFGIKKGVWERIGGFDEDFITGYEDVDLGLRAIKGGCRTGILDLSIRHLESQSSGRFEYVEHNVKMLDQKYPQEELIALKEKYKNFNCMI
jgi:GT2 family glycosyltransferase